VVARCVVSRLEGDIWGEITRRGAMEALWCVVDRLGLALLPYLVLLVVPVLRRMSDQDESVRQLASLTFATLVRLMPLEGGSNSATGGGKSPNMTGEKKEIKVERGEGEEGKKNPSFSACKTPFFSKILEIGL
jgi:hypothetical protein